MAISKFLDSGNQGPTVFGPNPIGDCSSCMYGNNGVCALEWCAFRELPAAVSATRIVKCPISEEESQVSVYSGLQWKYSDKVQEKLKNFIEAKCMVCSNELSKDEFGICKTCGEAIDKLVIKQEKTCAICNTKYTGDTGVCSECAVKIKEKLAE